MSEYTQERKGFWHEPDGTPTSEGRALEAWVRAAHEVLVRTAGSYHAVVREAALAEELQITTSIRTTRPYGRWLDKVLGPVAALCETSGEPPLTSLVVGAHDDLAAARARLECYRWAGSAPADGGEPRPLSLTVERTPRAAGAAGAARAARPTGTAGTARTGRTGPAGSAPPRRVARSDRPVAVCPTCFMALPATGVCDTCGD